MRKKIYQRTETRHIPAETSRESREEGVTACAPKKRGVISEKSEKIRENGQKIGQKFENKLFKGKNGSHTC